MTCARCGSDNIINGVQYNQSGSCVVIARCQSCGDNPYPGKPFLKKSDFDLSQLPVLEDYREYAEPCAVCKEKTGTEYHHIAPRYIFGNECENWPGVWLCRSHHKEWHDKVTPNMTRRKP